MSAITQARTPAEKSFKTKALPLAYGAGMIAYRNAAACIDTATGQVKPMAAGNENLIRVGWFEDYYNNSAGSANAYVLVNLDRELFGRWYDNATGENAVTQLFGLAFPFDNNTFASAGTSGAVAGRVWEIDAVQGVLVVSTVT
jgi:hypothetical protein